MELTVLTVGRHYGQYTSGGARQDAKTRENRLVRVTCRRRSSIAGGHKPEPVSSPLLSSTPQLYSTIEFSVARSRVPSSRARVYDVFKVCVTRHFFPSSSSSSVLGIGSFQ